MSPTYWVYLVMAVTVLFNAMKAYSRFRLWRIDAAREKLVARLWQLAGSGPARADAGAAQPVLPIKPRGRRPRACCGSSRRCAPAANGKWPRW
jgi:hypothetical protein